MTTRVLVLAALAALAPNSALAADAARDALNEVARCADIAEAAARLKCFDAAAARAKAALAEPPPAVRRESLLERFGLARPPAPARTPSEFGKPPPPEAELTEITATVVDFARTPRGQVLFVLDNGQVWRQLDADTTSVPDPIPGRPMKVKIEKGFLGSYNLIVDGRNPLIKVFRLK